MSETLFKEALPKKGLLFTESQPQMVLCKPKLLPLKSVTLEKMERMQKEARDRALAEDQALRKTQEEDERRAKAGTGQVESVSFE